MTLHTDAQAAPDFTLPDERGRPVHLADLLGRGPVLLLFYRGDWCSYCNAQLAGYALRHGELDALGARVLAISVDGSPDGAALKTKLRFPFPVLSDPTHAVIDRYGGIEARLRAGIAIGKPATYVLDAEGRIRWSYVGEDFADRPLVEEVIEQVRRVAGDA
jgi:peroxiredoxin